MINYQLAKGGVAPVSARGLQPGWMAYVLLAFPLIYLLLPTLESAVLYDFHAVTLAPPFLLFAFLALERAQPGRFWLFAGLAMACKEDMPLVVAMLGLYTGLAHGRWRQAALIMAVSLGWFAAAVLAIQPLFAGGNIQLDRYAWLGSGPVEIVWTAVTEPGRVWAHLTGEVGVWGYLFNLFFPTGFVALLNPLTLLPMLPNLAINWLSANPFPWRLEDFHYGAPLAPFLVISTIYGVGRVVRVARSGSASWVRFAGPFRRSPAFYTSLTGLILVFAGTYHYYRGYTPLARGFTWPERTAHHAQVAQIIAGVPAGTAVFAQSNLAPHLSQRETIYGNFAYFTDPAFAARPVDDIVLDVTSLENFGGLHEFLQMELLQGGGYHLAAARDGVLHLRRAPGAEPIGSLPEAFFSIVRVDGPPQYALTVDFGESLRLTGYSLHFNRQEEIEVTADFAVLESGGVVRPVLYLLDAAGEAVGATVDRAPGLVWYPPERWQAGERVRLRFNTLPWYTRETAHYRLALGVVEGGDVWAIPARLEPVPAGKGPWATRLPAGGTLVELARIAQAWNMPGGGPVPRRFEVGAVPEEVGAAFGGVIRLVGYAPPRLEDAALTVSLRWQAMAAPPEVVRFVQLVGPDNTVLAQSDAAPDRGQYPPQLWQPGEVVPETVRLNLPAPSLPEGSRLLVGWYDPATGQRLTLPGGGDYVVIPPGDD